MNARNRRFIHRPPVAEPLEGRRLLATTWSDYARLINQDDAAKAYSSLTGRGQTVAVLDTGIDYTLDVLGNGIGSGKKVVAGYDFLDDDDDPMDEDGHGTSVAGMIAAKSYTVDGVTYRGIAPDARLVALRIGTDDNISYGNIEAGLQWVIENAGTYDISVVNLSIGSSSYTDAETDATLSDEFAQLRDMGVFVVAASGNSNDEQTGPISQDGIAYPAADPSVFAVGAVDASDVIPSWSQRGDELDLLAPGDDVVLPDLGGGTTITSGTSFAAPMVAGAAALIHQFDKTARAGDIGSILMSSGTNNRDGAGETGNTTDLQFARLDLKAALDLAQARSGDNDRINLGTSFDTALDSEGVLHAAWYDGKKRRLIYATRATDGDWSDEQVIDAAGRVGTHASIAVDLTGKVGIAYYDEGNTALKYASFNGTKWSTRQIDTNKNVGTYASLAFDIDGNAWIAYHKKSGGQLKLARQNRDANTWSTQIIDGASGSDVGTHASLDIGEVAVSGSGFFTTYDTTVAIAYGDATHGDLKYARRDIDSATATWYVATVDNMRGVANIDLNLHPDPGSSTPRAQIAYQDTANQDVKYAYKVRATGIDTQDWVRQKVASKGNVGGSVQLAFDADEQPIITYFNRTQRAIYTCTRDVAEGTFGDAQRIGTGAGDLIAAYNDRSGDAMVTWLNRTKSAVNVAELA